MTSGPPNSRLSHPSQPPTYDWHEQHVPLQARPSSVSTAQEFHEHHGPLETVAPGDSSSGSAILQSNRSDLGAGMPRNDYDHSMMNSPQQDGYNDPYGGSRSFNAQIQRKPSSISPWDSASQRGENDNDVPPMPNYRIPDYRQQMHDIPPNGRLSYIDEDGNGYYRQHPRPSSLLLSNQPDDLEMRGLIEPDDNGKKRRETFGRLESSPYILNGQGDGGGHQVYVDSQGAYNWLFFSTGLDRLLALFGINNRRFPVSQAVERKMRGIPGQRWPIATWILTVAMCGLMVYELVRNNTLTGKPIALKPNFNYMIGPTPEVLINLGARFPPCMKLVEAIPPTLQLACLNDTSSTPTTSCSLEEICGHGGFPDGIPNQTWRFVYPIFLHVGIIHLLVNMIAQVLTGGLVEREMGTVPFLMVYMAGGIYGFLLGGNFSRPGVPSMGASGALFATNACVLVDLLLHWKYEERPKLKAFLLFVEFLIGFAIGYIPNAVDGLAHLGGWAMGILMGIILYPSISETKRHRYIVWGLRAVALPLIILAFVLTIKNFYTKDPVRLPPIT